VPKIVDKILLKWHNKEKLMKKMFFGYTGLFCIITVVLLNSCLSFNLNGNSDNAESLLRIARFGTTSQAKKAIANGANINEKNQYGVTPLMLACGNKDTGIAKLLIEANADVDIQAVGGFTPLFYAVEINRDSIIEIINLLISYGAELEHRNYKGQTVLLYAAEMNDNEKIIQTLIDLGADGNAKDSQGNGFAYFTELNKGNKGIIY
jgi:ankyrin repeat protein